MSLSGLYAVPHHVRNRRPHIERSTYRPASAPEFSQDDDQEEQLYEPIYSSRNLHIKASTYDEVIQDNIQEILPKLASLDDDIWGKIILMERNKRTAKAYLRTTTVVIDGSQIGFDGRTIGFNSFENPYRDNTIRQIKSKIYEGVLLKMDYQGNIRAVARGMSPVFVQGWKNSRTSCVGARVVQQQGRLQTADPAHPNTDKERSVKVFDMKLFKRCLQASLASPTPEDRLSLVHKTCIRISLCKDGNEPIRTPCWFMLVNLVALDMLSTKLASMPNVSSIPPRIHSAMGPRTSSQDTLPALMSPNMSVTDLYGTLNNQSATSLLHLAQQSQAQQALAPLLAALQINGGLPGGPQNGNNTWLQNVTSFDGTLPRGKTHAAHSSSDFHSIDSGQHANQDAVQQLAAQLSGTLQKAMDFRRANSEMQMNSLPSRQKAGFTGGYQSETDLQHLSHSRSRQHRAQRKRNGSVSAMRWSAGGNGHHLSSDTIYEPMEHEEDAGESTDYGGSTTDCGSTRAHYPRRLMQPTLKQPRETGNFVLRPAPPATASPQQAPHHEQVPQLFSSQPKTPALAALKPNQWSLGSVTSDYDSGSGTNSSLSQASAAGFNTGAQKMFSQTTAEHRSSSPSVISNESQSSDSGCGRSSNVSKSSSTQFGHNVNVKPPIAPRPKFALSHASSCTSVPSIASPLPHQTHRDQSFISANTSGISSLYHHSASSPSATAMLRPPPRHHRPTKTPPPVPPVKPNNLFRRLQTSTTPAATPTGMIQHPNYKQPAPPSSYATTNGSIKQILSKPNISKFVAAKVNDIEGQRPERTNTHVAAPTPFNIMNNNRQLKTNPIYNKDDQKLDDIRPSRIQFDLGAASEISVHMQSFKNKSNTNNVNADNHVTENFTKSNSNSRSSSKSNLINSTASCTPSPPPVTAVTPRAKPISTPYAPPKSAPHMRSDSIILAHGAAPSLVTTMEESDSSASTTVESVASVASVAACSMSASSGPSSGILMAYEPQDPVAPRRKKHPGSDSSKRDRSSSRPSHGTPAPPQHVTYIPDVWSY